MHVFLDFEASSLAKQSYPIEVAWIFENGEAESHLIRPATGWNDWDIRSEAIHHIPRATLLGEGEAHEAVARRMVARLTGHDLAASAPSWDGKWLSTLLRAAGLPRHALRLRATQDVQQETVCSILKDHVPPERLSATAAALVATIRERGRNDVPLHRALADATVERDRWLAVRDAAEQLALSYSRRPS